MAEMSNSHPDLEMIWEANRLKTFKNWPFQKNHACSAEAMAKAGFYACGGEDEKDLAKCFVCLKELTGWEANDDPMKEHKTHNRNCPFVKLNKTESEITVYEMVDLFRDQLVNIAEFEFKRRLEAFDEEIQEGAQRIMKLNSF